MASRAAQKRLTKEYQMIAQNPPPFITAHPSDSNILEWHYILTGPPDTPYHGGQYWGTLIFPPSYPFAPPAIRMHTPSGRFQPSTRLCLSMSDFHPKTFNPAWEVSTILMGLLSFMTSEEMTTGSLSATERERKLFASQTRWWNSTCGGSTPKTIPGISGSNASGKGNVKAGDGGAKFKAEWPQLDEENWNWMKEHRIDPATGKHVPDPKASSCAPGATAALRRHSGGLGSVVEGGQTAREVSQGWIWSHKFPIAFGVLLVWVVFARVMSDGREV
ncbi:MAG: Ubiquitin-conjugating enzyme E2 6 [Alyxoria varia]|nr:MAG: Ubiquitin-conjugating enzyme E2 6 [Alyxoria varia]